MIDTPVVHLSTTDGGSIRPGRVYCIGRNYAAHAREMGHDPDREPPFFFGKELTALTHAREVAYPARTSDLHHEIELVVVLGRGGREVPRDRALELVWGCTVGIDLTRRDLQAEAKRLGRPWQAAKSFTGAAPLAPIVPMAQVPSVERGRIWLEVDGVVRQDSDLGLQIWSVAELIHELSTYDTLLPGDVIMTGTPEGVAAVTPGQSLRGGIDGLASLEIALTPAQGG